MLDRISGLAGTGFRGRSGDDFGDAVLCEKVGQLSHLAQRRAPGLVFPLLPEGGLSDLDIPGGPSWNLQAMRALLGAIDRTFVKTATQCLRCVPHYINDPAFSAIAASDAGCQPDAELVDLPNEVEEIHQTAFA